VNKLRTGEKYTYNDVDFDVVCSGLKHADGNIHLTLKYKCGRTIIAQRYAQAKTDVELEDRVKRITAPELFVAIIPNLRDSLASGGLYNDIVIFWNSWKNLVAKQSGWNDDTTAQKEKILRKLFTYLKGVSMKALSTDDYIEAAQKLEEAPHGKRRYFAIEALKLLSKISAAATLVGICDVDPLESIVENIRSGRDEIAEIKDHLRIDSLSFNEERAVFDEIERNIELNSGYFGIALVMLGGLTYNEACALTVADIHESECFPGLRAIFVSKECRSVKKSRGDRDSKKRGSGIENLSILGTRSAYRAIPMSSALDSLYLTRLNQITQSSKNDPANRYLVCIRQTNNNQMSPDDLQELSNNILKTVGLPETSVIRNADHNQKNIRISLPKDLLRQNFTYRLRWACMLKEAEIKYLTGKCCMDTDIRHYRDMLSDFELLSLKQRIDNWVFPSAQQKTIPLMTQESSIVLPDEIFTSVLSSPDNNLATAVFVNISTSVRQTIEVIVSSKYSFSGSAIISTTLNGCTIEGNDV